MRAEVVVTDWGTYEVTPEDAQTREMLNRQWVPTLWQATLMAFGKHYERPGDRWLEKKAEMETRPDAFERLTGAGHAARRP